MNNHFDFPMFLSSYLQKMYAISETERIQLKGQ